jgi:uncharacterized protein (DUF58 family)
MALTAEEFLKKVRAIELQSRRLIKQGLAGQYLSAFRGSGMQFREFRNYVYGDDVRHISWSVSARSNDPVLKTFEEERERTFMIIVDASASLRKGAWAQQKAERLAEAAATLALSASDANDKVGLIVFTDQVEKVIKPAQGQTHVLRVIRDVLGFEPKGKKTNPNPALRQIDKLLKKQSIVFYLSDMEVMPEETLIRRAAARHDFVAVAVDNPAEWSIPEVGFLEVQTAESERPVTLDTMSPTLRRYMAGHGATRKAMVEQSYKRMGVDMIWLDTQEDFVSSLRSYFKRRIMRGR